MDDYEYVVFGFLNIFNDSSQEYERFLQFKKFFLFCMYLVVFICGLMGNFLVLVIYIFYQKLKSLTDVFLMNLFLVDLVFVCTFFFWVYVSFYEWVFGNIMCKILLGIYILNFYIFMFIFICIIVDRFIVVGQVIKVYNQQVKRRIWGKVICLFIWVIFLLVFLSQIIYGNVFYYDKFICGYQNEEIFIVIFVIQMILGFFLSLFVMIVCYLVIIKILFYVRGFQKYKFLKIIFLLVVVFLLIQIFFIFVKFIFSISWEYQVMISFQYVIIVIEVIVFLRVCFNFVFYVFVGLKFRKNFWKFVKDIGCFFYLGVLS